MTSLIGIFLFTLVSQGSGFMMLDGQFEGKTENTVSIVSGRQIFQLKKKALSQDQVRTLEKIRWNDPVSISVPMKAIESVRIVVSKK